MSNENMEIKLFRGAVDVNVSFAEKLRCIYDYFAFKQINWLEIETLEIAYASLGIKHNHV